MLIFLALTVIIAFRYVIISGVFYWLLWARPRDRVGAVKLMQWQNRAPGAVRREILWSLAVIVRFTQLPAAIVFELWNAGGTAVYLDVQDYPLWYLPVSILRFICLRTTPTSIGRIG